MANLHRVALPIKWASVSIERWTPSATQTELQISRLSSAAHLIGQMSPKCLHLIELINWQKMFHPNIHLELILASVLIELFSKYQTLPVNSRLDRKSMISIWTRQLPTEPNILLVPDNPSPIFSGSHPNQMSVSSAISSRYTPILKQWQTPTNWKLLMIFTRRHPIWLKIILKVSKQTNLPINRYQFVHRLKSCAFDHIDNLFYNYDYQLITTSLLSFSSSSII